MIKVNRDWKRQCRSLMEHFMVDVASRAGGGEVFCWVVLGKPSSHPTQASLLALLPRSLVLPSHAGATTGSHLPQINHLPPLRASQCNQGAGEPLGHQGVKRLRQGK